MIYVGGVPSHLPLKFVCGSDFAMEHAMSCSHEGLPSQHHNELHDFAASLLSEVYGDVAVEPDLQPLSDETLHYHSANVTDEVRLDVRAQGFWGA